VRVADVKFPLPYKPKSFDLVVVSDALDYLTPRYLNKTLPDLARVSNDGLVIFSGKLLHVWGCSEYMFVHICMQI
jgi:putative pectin methylesterase